MTPRAQFAIVGTGFRAHAYLRLAASLPDRFEVSALVARRPGAASETAALLGIPVIQDVAELDAATTTFALTAVSAESNASVLGPLVTIGMPVLAETPAAADLASLRDLWDGVGASGLVQVAEQYPRQPMTAARLTAIRAGLIGTPTSSILSMTQTYHAVAVLRAALGVGCTPAEVRAAVHTAPLVTPFSRAGWTNDPTEHDIATTVATLDFGSARAVYDFTDGQPRNPLRASRFIARGSTGEIVDERVTRLADATTVVESALTRRDTGMHHDFEIRDLDLISLDGDTLYRNPFYGARLSDEEIAMADLLEAMGRWCAGDGPEPYPLAEAAQDQLLGLAIQEAAHTGETVHVGREAWSR
jgi:hypothetical protein